MKKENGAMAFLMILGGMFLVSFFLLLIFSGVMLKGNVGSGFISGGVIAAYVISCLAGGFCMGQVMGKHKFLWGIVMGLCYFSVLFLVGHLCFQGEVAMNLQVVSSFFICIVSGMLGGMFAPRVRK